VYRKSRGGKMKKAHMLPLIIAVLAGFVIFGYALAQDQKPVSATMPPNEVPLSPLGQKFYQRVIIPELQQLNQDGQDLVQSEMKEKNLPAGNWQFDFNRGALFLAPPATPPPAATKEKK
jgi:hypothetical protein